MRTSRSYTSSLSAAFFLICCVLHQSLCFAAIPIAVNKPKELDGLGFSEAAQLKSLLQKTNEKSDLARIKLTIDKMVDPSIDIEANLKKIDTHVAQARSLLASKPTPSDTEKLDAVRKYLYEAGAWNNHQPFTYDLADPEGTDINAKLLPTYLKTRKGNCVSMPILFAIIGQRMGLDVTLSTAPLHVFVKYTDRSTGSTINIETTSGGNPARDSWLREQFPTMTDLAIKNGMYMKRLSKQESAAVMGVTLAESFKVKQQYQQNIILSEIILHYYPTDASTLTMGGDSFARLVDTEFVKKYPRPMDIPPEKLGYYRYLSDGNRAYFSKAESLGWRPETQGNKQDYLQGVQQVKGSVGLK